MPLADVLHQEHHGVRPAHEIRHQQHSRPIVPYEELGRILSHQKRGKNLAPVRLKALIVQQPPGQDVTPRDLLVAMRQGPADQAPEILDDQDKGTTTRLLPPRLGGRREPTTVLQKRSLQGRKTLHHDDTIRKRHIVPVPVVERGGPLEKMETVRTDGLLALHQRK